MLMISTSFYAQYSPYPPGSNCQNLVDLFNSNYDALLVFQFEQVLNYNAPPSFENSDFFAIIIEGYSWASTFFDPISLLQYNSDFTNFVYELDNAIQTMGDQLFSHLTDQLYNQGCY